MKIDYQNTIIQIGNENFTKCMHDRIVEIIDNNKIKVGDFFKCPQCNVDIIDLGDRYCRRCGQRIIVQCDGKVYV
jgi:hypothetical protein